MPKKICGEYAVYLEDSECPDVYVEFRDFSDSSQAMQFISWLEEVLEASTEMALMPSGESGH